MSFAYYIQAIINGDLTTESSRQTLTPTQQQPPTITEITIVDESPPLPAVDDKVGEGEEKKTPPLMSINVEKTTEGSMKFEKIHSAKGSIEGNLVSDPKHHSKSLITPNQEDLKITKSDNDTKDNSEKAIPGSDDVINVAAIVENVESKNNGDDKVATAGQPNVTATGKDTNIDNTVEVSDGFIKVGDNTTSRNDSVSKITTQLVANQPYQQKPPTAEKSISQSSKRNRNLRPDASADLNMQWYGVVLSFLSFFFFFGLILFFRMKLRHLKYSHETPMYFDFLLV